MYLLDYLNKFKDKKIRIYVDMDGVIADYDVGKAKDYDKKRPLITSINKLEEISKLDNVELFILSITRETIGRDEKNKWLDQYAPFFKRDNRIIISREENNYLKSKLLKNRFFSKLKRDDSIIILIDDDPAVIDKIRYSNTDIIILKDTALVD